MNKRVIANLKTLGIDMIENAKSGHPGIVLGSAPIIYTVFANHMNINHEDPLWINRDRFILSAGHGSALLYATLYMAGYDLTVDDLKMFRKINSKTPGHPEYGVTPGVDMSTGPLGQGIASAVGMAIAEKMLKEKFHFPKEMKIEQDHYLVDYNIYVLVGDGDLMEGLSYEAASLAGNLNLDNLIVLYDSNNISLDGDTSNTFVENVIDRFKAMGWHTNVVKNNKDLAAIDNAIEEAKASGRPSFIEIKTTIGEGSLLEGTNKVHGKPLSKDDIIQLKQKLNINPEPFFVDLEAREFFKQKIKARTDYKYKEWINNYQEYVRKYLNGNDASLRYLFTSGIKTNILNFPWQIKDEAMRDINSYILSEIGFRIPMIVGGSADLASSTKAYISSSGEFKEGNYSGRNIWFGVREGAMGAILNGLALTNFRPFGSTFLSFADYMKPSIRMAALIGLPVTYIFTHDSIAIGEDGPTHQPVEQLTMLRSIPNLNVYRPGDANELIGCWNEILNSNHNPSALIVSKDVLPLLNVTNKNYVKYGAYIIRKEKGILSNIIIATGSEVNVALNIANELYQEQGIDIRVISMPSMELYLKQPLEYKRQLIPKGIKTIVMEAGSSLSWYRFTNDEECLLTIDTFGISGSKDEVLKHFNYDYQDLKNRIINLVI